MIRKNREQLPSIQYMKCLGCLYLDFYGFGQEKTEENDRGRFF